MRMRGGVRCVRSQSSSLCYVLVLVCKRERRGRTKMKYIPIIR